LSASCSSLVISSVVASTLRFTTLSAFVSALSSAFSIVGSPHRDQPCLAGGELLGQLVEFLARQGPAAEPLGDDTDARAIHPLDHVGFAVLLVDDGRIERADRLVLVQGLDGVQVCLCGRDAAVGGGVDDHGLLVRHDISLISGYPADGSRPAASVAAGR